MKLSTKIDVDKRLNFFIMGLGYFFIWLLSYDFFTRHIAHHHPKVLFLFLFLFLFTNKFYKLKIFIPVKFLIITIVSFTFSVTLVWIFTEEYRDYFFEMNTLYSILISPIGGFDWMKLYIVFPIITFIYIIIYFINERYIKLV